MSDEDSDWTHYDVTLGPLGATLEVAPDESESGTAVVEHTLPPKSLGAPLHRHTNEDEFSRVLEGELTVQQGETVSTATAGEYVVKPRGVWHTFWNAGTEPVRFVEVITPGEFARYFEEAAAAYTGERPDPATMAEVSGRYDLEMRPETYPDLLERHGLGP